MRVTADFQTPQSLRSDAIRPGVAAYGSDAKNLNARGIQEHVVHWSKCVVIDNDAPRIGLGLTQRDKTQKQAGKQFP
ncbi:MAG: hypothetical protein Cons2KO_00370 [Congregibacter sp.]